MIFCFCTPRFLGYTKPAELEFGGQREVIPPIQRCCGGVCFPQPAPPLLFNPWFAAAAKPSRGSASQFVALLLPRPRVCWLRAKKASSAPRGTGCLYAHSVIDSPPPDSHLPVQSLEQLEVTPVTRFVARRPESEPPERGTKIVAEERVGLAGEHLAEFGMLSKLVADPLVTDVFVNGPGDVWTDRGEGLVPVAFPSLDETHLRDLAVRLISAGGRHIDEATPCVDVRLHDGIRVHAVLSPISPAGTLLSIRLPGVTRLGVAELERAGFFELVPAETVTRFVDKRANILITGAGGSGKTTLLSALLATATETDRIVAIEDVAELRVAHPHFVSLETRQANLEGAGEVGLQRLVRESLRMRPDRLVLGECRGSEIRELLAALNTGHDGGAGTLHANSLADVPARLEALGALAGMSVTAVARQTVSAIDVVLHVRRENGVRRLVEIGRFTLDAEGKLAVVAVADGLASDAIGAGRNSS